MLEFEETVAAYCTSRGLVPERSRVLVALSGGGDSVALLHCLHAISGVLGATLEAAHLNHALRGAESDADEEFCRGTCAALGIPLTVKRLSPGELDGRGESLETAARNERRKFLCALAAERECTRVATGHTRNDLAETVLHRLIRGTGPSGLAGILPISERLWVRPLLGASRGEARAYLRGRGIPWREDSSNQDTGFYRNRIRRLLVPLLEERFSPAVTESIARLAELARSQEEYLEESTREAFRKCCIYKSLDKILLDVPAFVGYHMVLRQRMVRYCLETMEGEGRDTDRDEIDNILTLVASGRGEIDVTARVRFGVGRGVAAFVIRDGRFDPVSVRLDGVTGIPSGGRIVAQKVSDGARVDGRNAVLARPGLIREYGALSVGPARRGEYMVPFGMEKPVKVYEILSGSVTPRVLRDCVPVVRAGATPVWIPGLKSAECLRLDGTNGGEGVLLVYADGPGWR